MSRYGPSQPWRWGLVRARGPLGARCRAHHRRECGRACRDGSAAVPYSSAAQLKDGLLDGEHAAVQVGTGAARLP